MKSPIFTVRSPPAETICRLASSAVSTAGQSADGSACATLPPMVPMLRTCASPMFPAASAIMGSFFFTSSETLTA